MTKLLDKSQILAANDIEREEVSVPEWGGVVGVRGMTGKERDQFENDIVTVKGKNSTVNLSNMRARLCALTICDENGVRLFTDSEVAALGGKSAAALTRVFMVAQRLSGLTDEDVTSLTEELEQNPSSGSRSD